MRLSRKGSSPRKEAKYMEEIRQYRQNKLNKKIERLRRRAERLEKLADEKQAAFNAHRGDIAFLTQPASKSSAFGRQRDRIYKRYDQGIKLQTEANEAREKADYLEKRGAAVKGDAERARQKEREQRDKIISVGSKINDFAYGKGAVIRVNKKTYTIRFSSGFTCTRDKTYVELLKEEVVFLPTG